MSDANREKGPSCRRVQPPAAGRQSLGRAGRGAGGGAGAIGRHLDRHHARHRRSEPPDELTSHPGLGFDRLSFDLTAAEHETYYLGYSNSVLWPLFHGRADLLALKAADLEGYRAVNKRMAQFRGRRGRARRSDMGAGLPPAAAGARVAGARHHQPDRVLPAYPVPEPVRHHGAAQCAGIHRLAGAIRPCGPAGGARRLPPDGGVPVPRRCGGDRRTCGALRPQPRLRRELSHRDRRRRLRPKWPKPRISRPCGWPMGSAW
jgi:hypothetical protein